VSEPSPPITVSVGAQPAALRILRVVVACAASLVDMPLDEVDDLRIAVDEAATLLMDAARDPTTIRLRIAWRDRTLMIEVDIDGSVEEWPAERDRRSWSWMVLEGLTSDARFVSPEGRPGIRFSSRSAPVAVT